MKRSNVTDHNPKNKAILPFVTLLRIAAKEAQKHSRWSRGVSHGPARAKGGGVFVTRPHTNT